MKSKANHKNHYRAKWMVIGMLLALSLFCFAGCGTDNDEAKDTGTPVVAGEEQNDNQAGDPDPAIGQEDNGSKDGTAAGSASKDSTTDGGAAANDNATIGDAASGSDPDTTPSTPASTCTIQINCGLLVGKDLSGTGLETLVPANGVILGTTKVTLKPGDTVYDVTLRVTKNQKIHMSTVGSEAMDNLYVEALSNIYEKDYGARSGWVYLVNGKKPGIGCSVQSLKAGDKLVWAYSLDLGNDL